MPEIIPFQQPAPANVVATIRQIADLYLRLEGPELADRTLKQRRHHLELLVAAFGNMPWDGLHKSELRAWIRDHKAWRSDHTRRNALNGFKRCFQWAFEDERISRNPFRGLSWPEGGQQRSTTLAERQLALRHSPPPFRRAMIFLWVTGARPQDVESLERTMIEFYDDAQGLALIPEHKTKKKTGEPKPLHLPAVAVKLLRWILRRFDDLGSLFPGVESQKVFTGSRGQPLTAAALSQHFHRLRDEAGIPKDCKLYGFRHSLGNRLQAAGVDVRTTADVLNHRSTRTTERYYLHAKERRKSITAAVEKANKTELG